MLIFVIAAPCTRLQKRQASFDFYVLAKHAMNAACSSPEAEDGLCYSVAAFPK